MSRHSDDARLAAFSQRRSGLAARARELAARLREGEDPVRRAIRARRVTARARETGRSGLVVDGRVDWDLWRHLYDELSWADQVDFYAQVAAVHPEQSTATHRLANEFFDALATRGVAPSVLELGGWDGALAAAVLARDPEIRSWLNLEVASEPVARPACTDPRYEARVPTDFAWQLPPDSFAGRDTLVASHVIEHMKLRDVASLLDQMNDLRWCYIEAPLREHDRARSWFGYPGSHVLEAGWVRIERTFADRGFRVWGPIASFARCFERT